MRRASVLVVPHCRVVLAFLCLSSRLQAQELEPRAYADNPINIGFVIAGFGYSTGSVVSDPTQPISDIEADLYSITLGAGGTFSFLGRTASASLGLPFVWGDVSGVVGETADSITRSGFADPRLRLALNVLGGPARKLPEFVRRKPTTLVGVSLQISVPTGEYMPDKLINLGTNRWAFKPDVGISQPLGKWTLEAQAGVWLFTTNPDYLGGRVRKQAPLYSLQGHVGYTFRPGLWAAANATYYSGGRAEVDGVSAPERTESTRIGLTLSVPTFRNNSIKLAWSTGATVRFGGDFDTFGIAWQSTLLGAPKPRVPAPAAP